MPSKVPLTTQVPYNLEDEFIDRTQKLLNWARQESLKPATAVPVSVSPPRPSGRSTSEHGRDGQVSIWPKVVIAAVVVVVILIVASLFMAGDGPSSPDGHTSPPQPSQPNLPTTTQFDKAAWAQWCEAYAKWFGRFLSELNDSNRQAFMGDSHLRLIVEKIDKARSMEVELDPSLVAQAPGADLMELALRQPKSVMNAQGAMNIRLGVGVINQIEDALMQWPILVRTQQIADLFESLGWVELASHVRSYTDAISTEAQANPVDSAVRLMAVVPQIFEVESVWQKVESLRQSIVDSGDPVLARFGDWVDDSARTAALASPTNLVKLRETLSDLQGISGRLAAVVGNDWQQIDHDTLQADGRIYHEIPQKVTEEFFIQWLREVKAYYRPHGHKDPRYQRQLIQRFEAVKANLAKLKAREDYQPIPELDQQVEQMQAQLAQIDILPWIVRDEAKVQRAADEADTALRAIDGSLKDARRQLAMAMQDYVAALKEKRQLALSGSQVIDAQWQRRRDELIEVEQDYPVLQRKIDRLESYLMFVDRQLSTGLPNEILTTTWSQTVARSVMWDRREEALAQLIEQTIWAGVTAAVGDESGSEEVVQLNPQQQAMVKSYNELKDKAADLVRDFTAVDQLFVGHYGYDESPGPDKRSIEQIFQQWSDDGFFTSPAIQSALGDVLTRVDRLKEVAHSNDRQFLWDQIPKGGDVGLAVSIAASRRLDDFPWPDDRKTYFDQMLFIQDRILKRIKRVEDPGRRDLLEQEAIKRGQARWRMYVDAAEDPLDFERAFARIDLFHVDPDSFDPHTRYNLLLYELKRTDSQVSETRLLEIVRTFQDHVTQIQGQFIHNRGVTALMTGLTELLLEEPLGESAPLSAKKMGPSASPIADVIAWEAVVEDDGAKIIYTWQPNKRIDHRLEFLRVTDAATAGGGSFYLCTTEVPVGLFLDVVREAKKWPDLVKMMWDYSPKDASVSKGPFVWIWKQYGKATQSAKVNRSEWLLSHFGEQDYTYADSVDPGPPSADHPLQQISAQAAIYFSRLLGCRLPTSKEWQTAHHQAGQGQSSMRSNLRDEQWLIQKDHVVHDVIGSATSLIVDWPDAAIFWPADLSQAQHAIQGDAEAATTDNDGYLWFSPVDMGSGSRFRNLVGNVAEYVFDRPKEVEQLASVTPDNVKKLLADYSGDLKVIGGSALSPPELENDQPYPVPFNPAKLGFSDVGLRLAFSVPDESLHEKFKRLVRSASYQIQ